MFALALLCTHSSAGLRANEIDHCMNHCKNYFHFCVSSFDIRNVSYGEKASLGACDQLPKILNIMSDSSAIYRLFVSPDFLSHRIFVSPDFCLTGFLSHLTFCLNMVCLI